MHRIVLGPMDRAVILQDNDVLGNTHIIRGGTYYGRVLFTEEEPVVKVEGSNILLHDCILERLL